MAASSALQQYSHLTLKPVYLFEFSSSSKYRSGRELLYTTFPFLKLLMFNLNVVFVPSNFVKPLFKDLSKTVSDSKFSSMSYAKSKIKVDGIFDSQLNGRQYGLESEMVKRYSLNSNLSKTKCSPKSEFDTLDSSYLAPAALFANQYFGTIFSERKLLWLCWVSV